MYSKTHTHGYPVSGSRDPEKNRGLAPCRASERTDKMHTNVSSTLLEAHCCPVCDVVDTCRAGCGKVICCESAFLQVLEDRVLQQPPPSD